MAIRFETLRIGIGQIQDALWDVRLVRATDVQNAFFVVYAMSAEGPLSTLDDASARCARTFGEVSWREGLEVGEGEIPCPVCGSPDARRERTPRAVCPVCVLEAVDREGRSVRFYNVSPSGGFEARPAGGPSSADHDCWIRSVRCWADEAHFGGIVIEAVGHELEGSHPRVG